MDSSAEKYSLSECNKLVQHKHASTVMSSTTHHQHQEHQSPPGVRPPMGVLVSYSAARLCSSSDIPSCSSTPSSCFCTSDTTTTGLLRVGSDQHLCSLCPTSSSKKRRTTTMNTTNKCSRPSRSRSRCSREEECFLFEKSAAIATKGKTTSTRARESSACCSQSNRPNSGSFGTSSILRNNGRDYPTEKQRQRRYKRRHSKVGKMFYENYPRSLLYLTSVSPNFDSQHQIIQNTQIELYEQIINKMESSMNVD
jgi:hypothetical protein